MGNKLIKGLFGVSAVCFVSIGVIVTLEKRGVIYEK